MLHDAVNAARHDDVTCVFERPFSRVRRFAQFTRPLVIALCVGVSTLIVGINIFNNLQAICPEGFQSMVGTDGIQRTFVRTIRKTPGIKELCIEEAANLHIQDMVQLRTADTSAAGIRTLTDFLTEASCTPTPFNKPLDSKGLNKKDGDKMNPNTKEDIAHTTLAEDVPFCENQKARYAKNAAKADTDVTKYATCSDREIYDRNNNGLADQTGDDPTTPAVETDYYEYGGSGQVMHLFT